MKKKEITNKNNNIFQVEYKYTITGGKPCETALWNNITVAAHNSKEVKEKLHNTLLTEYNNLECFTELILEINNIKRIGMIGII